MMRYITVMMFLCILFFSLTACKDSDPIPIIRIGIDETSIESFYHMDDFDLTEIEITLDHADGSSTRVPLDESMLTEEDLALLETTGTHTITVYHATHETVITIVILETGATERTMLFETGEGTPIDPLIAYSGIAIDAPPDPQRPGHVFQGWFAEETLDTPFVFDVMPEEDLTLYAKWQINTYQVTFYDSDGFTVLGTSMVNYGESAVAPEDPTKEADDEFIYVFGGWDKDFTDVRENMDVFATYVETTKTYTVTFWNYDGTILKEENVSYAQNATAPEDPFKEHHTFIGWDETFDRIVFDLTVTAQYSTNSYTVTFKDHDETVLKTEVVLYQTAATPPEDPFREGHMFIGWDKPTDTITGDLVVHALYEIGTYQLIFEDHDGTILHAESFEYDSSLAEVIAPQVPERNNHTFDGWQALPETMPGHHLIYTATYTHDVLKITMVQVGHRDVEYTIPIGGNDHTTSTVEGGYFMAIHETRYGLWYMVRTWAEENGYHFQNPGREGNGGTDGMPPTENHKNEPVTYVSWRDVIVWNNALSEMTFLDPVYRTETGEIIKDSRHANGAVVDAAIQTEHNGYRLPTSDEWEMAGRWRNTDGDNSIPVGGRYWTPGSYASGATDSYENEEASRAVAWYSGAAGGTFTRPVGQLMPNHLGLYDMSGNVWEWTYTALSSDRLMRGGSYSYLSQFIRVGYTLGFSTTQASVMGFRLARG